MRIFRIYAHLAVSIQRFFMRYSKMRINNNNNNNNNNSLHLYSAFLLFLSTQSALHCEGGGGVSSSTTSVQHPPGWCDGSHSAPDRSPHASLLVERRQSDEANQYMGMIRRPWWSEANRQIWPGCRGHTSTLFERHPGIFNDHRESGPRFNVSSEGRNKNRWMETQLLCITPALK